MRSLRSSLLSCTLALAMVGCSSEKPAPVAQIPEVGVITVTAQVVPYTFTFVAQTESSRQVEIVARVAGFLDRIAYAEGDFVKEGQTLFQIDPKPFKAQLEAAQGELGAQKARLATAKANLARVKPLAEQNALSQADLDRATGDFEAATASVYSASAKVREAELNLGYTTIQAPLSGAASRALQREGAYVGASADTAKLTYVAALDPIWVTFSVSQNQVARLKEMVAKKLLTVPGNEHFEIELVLPDGRAFPHRGRINFSDPSFSKETGTFMIRASVPNPDRELRPGMFVTANVIGAERPSAIVVPQLAVQQSPKGNFVVVANAENHAELRPVIVGTYVNDKEIVVEQGLKSGDRVIVDGLVHVVPNAPVKPTPLTAPAAKPAAAAAVSATATAAK